MNDSAAENWAGGCRRRNKEKMTLDESQEFVDELATEYSTATGQCNLMLATWLKGIRIEVC